MGRKYKEAIKEMGDKVLEKVGVRIDNNCPCGGFYDDWHSHASDCIVLDWKNGKDYGKKEGK